MDPEALLALHHSARMAIVRTPELDATLAMTTEIMHHRAIWDVLGALCYHAVHRNMLLRAEYRATPDGPGWWLGLGTSISLIIPKSEDGATQAFKSHICGEHPILANAVMGIAQAIGIIPAPPDPSQVN